MKATIVIVANKWWEAAPLLSVLQHYEARPKSIGFIGQRVAGDRSSPAPRATFDCLTARCEVWCLQDLMDPGMNPSLTIEKARVLHRVRRWPETPALVVAFGTAACPGGSGSNGSVVAGSTVFVHNPYPTGSDPHWSHKDLDAVIESPEPVPLEDVPPSVFDESGKRMLRPANPPSLSPELRSITEGVGISVVNVTDPKEYPVTDRKALDKFRATAPTRHAACLETTHGVIRLVLGLRFMFVSGLANGVGAYGSEVAPNLYAQNFAAAHNAAIGLVWLLPELISRLGVAV